MHCIKSFIFYAFLTLCTVQAKVIDRDETNEMATPLETLKPIENEILKEQADKDMNIVGYKTNYGNISNDVEVFIDKLGPQKEKQEEEIEAEGNEEEQPEVDEPKEEEAQPEEETAAQPETELDDDAAPEVETNSAAEAEPEPAEEPQPEEPKQEETPVEPEAEEEKKPEPGTDVEEGNETIPNTQTDESEMPNDEPAKEEENDEKLENEPTETLKTKNIDKQQVSCFTCTSNEDVKCPIKPTMQTPCPKVNDADVGKHNGCYTLYQAVTNTTTRGCVDELAEEGLKYCLTNDKLCSLCYSSGCNDQAAPSNTAKLQSNLYLLLFLTISSKIVKNFAN